MAGDVTKLLRAHQGGDQAALEQLANMVYPDLKAMARRRARGESSPSASTLVNETFIKLLSNQRMQPEDRKGFFALMATIMRRIVIDDVRQSMALKRKGQKVTVQEEILAGSVGSEPDFLLDVNAALNDLESQDERAKAVFECRYFAGFTTAETADALALSPRTVERDWTKARSFVAEHMSAAASDD